MKAEIEKRSVIKVIEDVTPASVLGELENLPTVQDDRTASIVLNSLATPNGILGFRRLSRDRWFVTALCFAPEVEPISSELTTVQVWTLVDVFFTDEDWIQLLRSH